MSKKLTQVEWLRARLEAGFVENQSTMLKAFIGNHTDCVSKLRKIYEKEGKGYGYIKTWNRPARNPRTGALTHIAEYYIEEKVMDSELRRMYKRGRI